MNLLFLNNLRSTSSKRFVTSIASAYDVLKSNNKIPHLTELKNGLRVASYADSQKIATVGVWIESGSSFETSKNNGVATFFEHLLYMGTKNRTTKQLHNELAKIGAQLNSYTTRDYTAYYAQCFSTDIEKVVEILADVMKNTQINSNKLEETRSILLQKIEESTADYCQVVFNNLHKTAFQGTTYSLSPLGHIESVKSITKKDLIDFVDDNYKPVRMVFTGVGGVEHEQLSELAQKHFGDLKNEYNRKIPQKTDVRFTGSEFLYRDDNYPLMYGAIALEGVPFGHIDAIPLLVASTFIGQWDYTVGTSTNSPSLLVQKLCNNSELQYFKSFSLNYISTGLFGVYFVMKGDDDFEIMKVVKTIQKEWKRLSFSVTDEEIDRAKNALKTNFFSALEDNVYLASHISQEVLTNNSITPLHQLERKIHYLNAASIQEAISQHVYDCNIACAGIGRTEAWPNYLAIRYGMSWWRL